MKVKNILNTDDHKELLTEQKKKIYSDLIIAKLNLNTTFFFNFEI